MSERRIQITGTVPLPTSLVEAGKLQSYVAEQVSMLQQALATAGVVATIDVKVVNTRPKPGQRAKPLPAEVRAEASQETEPEPEVSLTAATPPWARQS